MVLFGGLFRRSAGHARGESLEIGALQRLLAQQKPGRPVENGTIAQEDRPGPFRDLLGELLDGPIDGRHYEAMTVQGCRDAARED